VTIFVSEFCNRRFKERANTGEHNTRSLVQKTEFMDWSMIAAARSIRSLYKVSLICIIEVRKHWDRVRLAGVWNFSANKDDESISAMT